MFYKDFRKFIDSLGKDYAFIKKYSKRNGNFMGLKLDDLTDLPYDTLKNTVPDLFDSGNFEKAIYEIIKHYKKNITFGKVRRQKNHRKLLFLLWVHDQYKKINDIEAKYLYTPPEAKLLQAGIRELDILGDINTIDSLANGDVLKWNDIRQLPYSRVFDKMLKNTIEARINKKLIEINKLK